MLGMEWTIQTLGSVRAPRGPLIVHPAMYRRAIRLPSRGRAAALCAATVCTVAMARSAPALVDLAITDDGQGLRIEWSVRDGARLGPVWGVMF